MEKRLFYLTPAQVGESLGLKPATARILIKKYMHHIRIGNGRVLVEQGEFQRWLESRARNPQKK